ncbi:hypothetical protein HPB47_023839 [Ixodes persulcatus]|uniref:Uncharacterized protein n=1 Tax=Ixodes persulcatus TaxID=34615 RepID=A0AC60Q8V7_IXOPE|nr:hypothetical protein HPB47_023839 [Ixodes persulcatus]
MNAKRMRTTCSSRQYEFHKVEALVGHEVCVGLASRLVGAHAVPKRCPSSDASRLHYRQRDAEGSSSSLVNLLRTTFPDVDFDEHATSSEHSSRQLEAAATIPACQQACGALTHKTP